MIRVVRGLMATLGFVFAGIALDETGAARFAVGSWPVQRTGRPGRREYPPGQAGKSHHRRCHRHATGRVISDPSAKVAYGGGVWPQQQALRAVGVVEVAAIDRQRSGSLAAPRRAANDHHRRAG